MDEATRQKVGRLFHDRWERLGLDALLPEERDHVLLWSLHAEFTSGGLDQFLSNSSGDLAVETVAECERHGMAATADVLRRALNALPGGWCAEREERNRRLGEVPEELITDLNREYDASIASAPSNDSLGESILAAYRREGLVA